LIWLADENIPLTSIRILREAGIDVVSVRERGRGQTDANVLQAAHDEHRGLLTFDRGFGELIFRRRFSSPPAVIYIRFTPRTPQEPAEAILALLGSDQAVNGHFVVLDRGSFRRRKLPLEE